MKSGMLSDSMGLVG